MKGLEEPGGKRPSGRHPVPHFPSLLEMMLESALTDIKEAPTGVLASLTQQALWLLRLLQDFLCAEGHGNQELWSEKVRGSEGHKPVSTCVHMSPWASCLEGG